MTKTTTRAPLNPKEVFHSVITDEDFESDIAQRYTPARAFARTAMTLVELGTTDSGYRTQVADRLHVAATVDDYVAAQLYLDEPEKYVGQGSQVHTKELKLRIIDFNHALSQMIDNDPALNFNEVINYLKGIYLSVRPNTDERTRQDVCHLFERVLIGMRSEIFAEQLAGYLGYEVEGTTPEDELRGIDRFFIDGERWIPVDVKSTEATAIRARASDRNGRVFISPAVSTRDAGSGFRIDDVCLAKYASRFQVSLDDELRRVSTHSE